MFKEKNDKNLIIPTWYLLNKYQVLDYDINNGAYHDRMFDKSKEYIEYRKEIIRRFDEKTKKIGYLISKGKNTEHAFELSYKMIKVLHGIDISDKIYKLYTLCRQDNTLSVKNQVSNVLDLIECANKNLCFVKEINSKDISKNAEMVQFVLESVDKFPTLLCKDNVKINSIYKNITFINNLAEAGNNKNKINDVVSKHIEYLEWDYYHEPSDHSLDNYPQKELSPKALYLSNVYKNKEGM